jgi:aromatic-L-amino-acid decarboxylase
MESRGLDWPLPEFERVLQRAAAMVVERYRGIDRAPVFAQVTPQEVDAWFQEPVPEEPLAIDPLLDTVQEKILDTATLNIGPNMYAYVMAGGTHVSILAELLATAINQNGAKWHLGPALSALEQRVIQWGGAFIGFAPDPGGALVSGGSAANLMALTVARNLLLGDTIATDGLFAGPPATLYGSTEVHGCIDKSVELLGLGRRHFRRIPVDAAHHIRLDLLEQQIAADHEAGLRPFCVIGNAGTVNTGAVDPLDALADVAARHRLWLHVDGAYGGMAAAVEACRPKFRGLERADSVAIDFHKWLYQPFEGGCALFRGWEGLKRTFHHPAAYLATDLQGDGRKDLNEYSFQLSRNFKALKVWMTFKAYGARRLREAIAADLANAAYLAERLREAADFELVQAPELSIVCFRFLGSLGRQGDPEAIDRLNRAIIPALEKDGRVFITGTTLHGRPVIRACCINHRQRPDDLAFLLTIIRQVGAAGEASLR